MVCEECGKRMLFNEGWCCEPCDGESIRAEERERCARILEGLAEKQERKTAEFAKWAFDELAVICTGHAADYRKIAKQIRE